MMIKLKRKNVTQVSSLSKKLHNLFYVDTNEKSILTSKLTQLLTGRYVSKSLDVGPGPGLITEPLYKSCQELTLVEMLPEYEEILKEKFPNADILTMSFLDFVTVEVFDIILCSHVLYYFNDDSLDIVLDKLIDFLNYSGMLIIVLLDCDYILQYFKPKLGHLFGVNFIKINTIIDFLLKKGQVEFIEYFYKKKFKNHDDFIDYLFHFLSLKNKEDLLTCREEINKLSANLIKEKDYYILQQHGKLLILNKQDKL